MTENTEKPVIKEKTPDSKTEIAPIGDKPIEETTEATDTLDGEDIDEALMILNILDKEIGGKGEIAGIPEELRGSFKFIIEMLTDFKERFEDPLWKSIWDDMEDQKEDGKTPSVEVAIARNIPLEKIQTLAEGEDYEGVQNELTSSIDATKQAEVDEVDSEANFEQSKANGEESAKEMGYDEEVKNNLFQVILDLFKIMADGVITVEEFEKVDKMRNYDKDMEDVISQIQSSEAKEVLPDQASVEAAASSQKQTPKATPANGPGMSSMGAYDNTGVDVTQVGKRKRV